MNRGFFFSPFPLRFFSFFFVLYSLLGLCDVCDLKSHCATHIQALFKSVSAHLHVKLRICRQVACILISRTIVSKVVGMKLQVNATWLVSTIGVARHWFTYFYTVPPPRHPLIISKNTFGRLLWSMYFICTWKQQLSPFSSNSFTAHLWFILDI